MGQPITVTARPATSPSVWMFDLNRSLTGMALEQYGSVADAKAHGGRPPDVLAQRLFEAGADHVTVYSNTVTVEARAAAWGELEAKATYLIEHLFEYYGDDAGWSYEARGLEAPPRSTSPADPEARRASPEEGSTGGNDVGPVPGSHRPPRSRQRSATFSGEALRLYHPAASAGLRLVGGLAAANNVPESDWNSIERDGVAVTRTAGPRLFFQRVPEPKQGEVASAPLFSM